VTVIPFQKGDVSVVVVALTAKQASMEYYPLEEKGGDGARLCLERCSSRPGSRKGGGVVGY
jgi:hypothetical protein